MVWPGSTPITSASWIWRSTVCKRAGTTISLTWAAPKTTLAQNGLLANVSGPRTNYDDESRIAHFRDRLCAIKAADGGVGEPFVLHPADGEWKLAREEVQELLDAGATGVMCVNDHMALQVWDHLEAMGLRVPDDLSIVSVDNQQSAELRGLTSIGFGYDEVGRHAVQAWLALSTGTAAAQCSQIVPVQLIERASVGAPARREPTN